MQGGDDPEPKGERYKPSALRGYERALRKRVLPALGDKRLAGIRRSDVQAFIDALAAETLDGSTIKNTLNPLQAIFRYAVQREQIDGNPTRGLDVPKPAGKRDRIASPAEAMWLIEALPVEERAIWATAMYAGLRRGELRALRWSDVDLASGVIRVERGWDDKEGEIEAKTRAARRKVPIASVLRDYLVEHKVRQGGPAGTALVFGATATNPFEPSTIRRRALKAWEEAGLKRIGLHEGRHTFASLMIAAGVNAKALSAYMGHASVSITFDRYGHLMPGNESEAAELLDGYLARAATECRADGRTVKNEGPDSASESGSGKYRHGDSNPGFRRERAAS
jgi:integrase